LTPDVVKRPWQTWTLFVICLGIVLAAMAWVSSNVLRLERSNAEAQRTAALEEVVRLALWRMDSEISPLIIQESARPYFDYMAFNRAGTVYPNILDPDAQQELVPSPLLLEAPSNIVVYFNGAYVSGKERVRITSPQVPTGEMARLADNNYGVGSLIGANNDRLNTFVDSVSVDAVREELARAAASDSPHVQPPGRTGQQIEVALAQQRDQQAGDAQQSYAQVSQSMRNWEEFSVRKGQYEKVGSKVLTSKKQRYDVKSNIRVQEKAQQVETAQPQGKRAAGSPSVTVDESIMRPLWVNDLLVLARSVRVDGRDYVQGAWLNWDGIRNELLSQVSDLLPEARLLPMDTADTAHRSRLMAALPVRLEPGVPADLLPLSGSPLKIPLVIAWCCVLLAAGAVAILLVGAVSLSERRGAFVSAVTHELRTPLTTFRMYSEMLAEGMVTSEEKKKQYLETLRAEGGRLSHLVENVLSYARLEKGRAVRSMERISAAEIVERTQERLEQRTRQEGMTLVVDPPDRVPGVQVRGDLAAVEQILFNLVDNACKYASGATDKRIHLEMERRAASLLVRVRDHGQGIAKEETRRLFKPFRKSAKHAAETAPGVGLGLALSRQLARRMGGDLTADTAVNGGACFELTLPAQP